MLLGWLFGDRASQAALAWSLVPVRMTLGAMFAVSGAQKAFGWFGGRGFQATVQMVAQGVKLPLPGLFAVLLVFAELVGGALLVVGVATRFIAIQLAIAMTVAMLTVKADAGYLGTYLQQLIIAACACLTIAGGGRLRLSQLWSGPARVAGE